MSDLTATRRLIELVAEEISDPETTFQHPEIEELVAQARLEVSQA